MSALRFLEHLPVCAVGSAYLQRIAAALTQMPVKYSETVRSNFFCVVIV